MFDSLIAALQASPPAAALRASFVAYPLVNALHLFCAGALVMAVWLMHLALAGRGVFSGDARFGRLFRRIAVAALIVMAFSGLALVSVRASEYVVNPAFRVKMAMIVAALVNVALYHALSGRSAAMRRITAGLSVLLWPAVLVAGRFIGFV